MHWHQLRSHVPQVFQAGFALYFVSSIQLLSLYPFIQFLTCTRIPCRDSHCENGSFEVLSLHDHNVSPTPPLSRTPREEQVRSRQNRLHCVQDRMGFRTSHTQRVEDRNRRKKEYLIQDCVVFPQVTHSAG